MSALYALYSYGLLALMGVYSVPWAITYPIGTPKCHLSVEEVVSRACLEAEVYRHCGVHGLIVENMHDTPYLNGGGGGGGAGSKGHSLYDPCDE